MSAFHPFQSDKSCEVSRQMHSFFSQDESRSAIERNMYAASDLNPCFKNNQGQWEKNQPCFLRVPEVVDKLAKLGTVLCWSEENKWFEVLDGPLFEENFNALRCIRGKRKADAADRPFARMHVHFELVRGDRWACTGSAFRPKVSSTVERDESKSDYDLQTFNRQTAVDSLGLDGRIQNLSTDSTCLRREQHRCDPTEHSVDSDQVLLPCNALIRHPPKITVAGL